MNIAIAGTGYVGLSLAVLLSRQHTVTAVDILPEKVEMIKNKKSPIVDREIEDYLAHQPLNLQATLDAESAYAKADFIIIATPTNYDPTSQRFDTKSIDAVLKVIAKVHPEATIVIKSTVPVGYLKKTMARYPELPYMLFSPEFLREGRALYDNLHPSRIVVGVPENSSEELAKRAADFAGILQQAALDENVPVRLVHATEAECIKLFANSYLALRVAYFNELDSYAEQYGLNTAEIIEGVCLDPRIGTHYNNPSFGYGGYCLPKDTRQLKSNFALTPADLVPAIVSANETRKKFIVSRILLRKPRAVGIYRLIMKAGSDNFRQSAIQDVMRELSEAGLAIYVYEPMLKGQLPEEYTLLDDLEGFAAKCDVIVANRVTDELAPYMEKVYTRDLFQRD